MKKFLPALLFVLLLPVRAIAAGDFDRLLSDVINDYGVFDDSTGVFYASRENFAYGREYFLICRAEAGSVVFDVYNNADGEQLLDSLKFAYVPEDEFSVSLVYYDETAHVMFKSKDKTVFYALISDAFTTVPEIVYDDSTPIIGCSRGKLDTYSHNNQDIYNLLNSLKLEKINSYPYMNMVNTLDGYEDIKAFLSACANLTAFDIKDYDYDEVFKYVLYTHRDFENIVGILPYSDEQPQIKSVSGEYIDYIMQNILDITPEHPSATALTERGFCYKDGLYLYSGGFDGEYSTEILDLEAAYDLGGGIYYVVFSDIYSEFGSGTPEYSYAIINTSYAPYKLLRLGMGAALLTPAQIDTYALSDDLTTPEWEKAPDSKPDTGGYTTAVIALVASVALAAAIAAVVWIVCRNRG